MFSAETCSNSQGNQRPVLGLAGFADKVLAQMPVGGVQDAHGRRMSGVGMTGF